MIESRYKIEYVLPDDEVKKTSAFRMLWYVLLIPLIILAVTAITYDFSLKDITRDSTVLFEKAKVHVFNLGESKQINREPQPKSTIIEASVKPTKAKVVEAITPTKKVKKPEPAINQDKKIITELTTKQELQLKTIQSQIAKNDELTKNLNSMSEKLVLEQLENEKLSSKIVIQEKDRLELEEQLNKALEKELESEKLASQETIESLPESLPNIPEIQEEIQSETNDVAQTISNEVVVEDDKKEPSETDKIIAAMTDIKPENNETTEKPAESIEKLGTKPKTEEITESNEDKNNIEEENSKKVEPETLAVTPEATSIKTEKEVTIADNEETKIVVSNDLETEETTEAKLQTNGNSSAVDDIVAAMQQTQSNSISESNLTTNENIDSKLEKEIEQQLVEKGELSIDN